jgi:conjugative relaxase-like TrwC/TraI family protein
MEHRAGWDATFSAPKSVSITALVGGDTRVREAHRESVRVALPLVVEDRDEAWIPDVMVRSHGDVARPFRLVNRKCRQGPWRAIGCALERHLVAEREQLLWSPLV